VEIVDTLLVKKYINKRKTFDDKTYLFSTIACNIAPTLAGKKPATLLNFTKGSRNLQKLWERHKQDFMDGTTLDQYELRRGENSTLVLFYETVFLSEVIFDKKNMLFLEQFGYSRDLSLDQCLQLLKQRFEKMCPHESGIFLGIPVEDVAGFIDCGGRNYLLSRYWKVYHNPGGAINTFNSFDKAKHNVLNLIANGTEPRYVINNYSLN
jgi:hypothetical protein